MNKKRLTADDIEAKLKQMGARELTEQKFNISKEYSGIRDFVLEALEKKKTNSTHTILKNKRTTRKKATA